MTLFSFSYQTTLTLVDIFHKINWIGHILSYLEEHLGVTKFEFLVIQTVLMAKLISDA